jgi:hypothetical protein
MKKLVFVIIVLIGIMSSQLIHADESCGTASGIYHGTSYAITCKSGRQIKCDQVLSDQGMGWKCDCDEHDGCKGAWDSEIDQASKISCCSAENQIPVAGGSNVKSTEPVKSEKLTPAELRELKKATGLMNKGGEAFVVKTFFEMKNKYSFAFDSMMVKQVAEGVKNPNLTNTAASLTLLCIMLDLRFNDEMSCATTREEVKTIKDYKVIVNLYYNTLANYIKTLTLNGIPQAQFNRMKDDFFNRSIPLTKKLYLTSPEREHCQR